MKNDTTTSGADKKEPEQSLVQDQNPLKNVLECKKRDLELNQDFLLGDNVNHEKIIPQKKQKKYSSNKNYSTAKVKSWRFLTNISYNRLKSAYFNNASFMINFYTYILFNLNSIFLEQKFDDKNDRDFVETLWNYLVPNELYIYICRNDNFIELNKLTWKYQNAHKTLKNFITGEKNNFLRLKSFLKKNLLTFQYVYSVLFPKYFCRVDDYCIRNT